MNLPQVCDVNQTLPALRCLPTANGQSTPRESTPQECAPTALRNSLHLGARALDVDRRVH
jgi:hypothetical protein